MSSVPSIPRSFDRLFVCLFIRSFVSSIVLSFVPSLTHPFDRSLVCLFVCSFVPWFVPSAVFWPSVRRFVCLSVHVFV